MTLPGIPVKSSDGTKTYYVIAQGGKVTCTCPAGWYRQPCKHIDMAKAAQAAAAENPTKDSYPTETYRARQPGETLEDRYQRWRATPAGAVVYGEVVDRALALRRAGWRSFGIQAIAEAIRFDQAIRVGPDGEGFKVNNSYLSRLARDVMFDHGELREFFELRVLKSN
jgi:hypothetical protein